MRKAMCFGFFGMFVATAAAYGQSLDDRAICTRLTRGSYRTGLYIVYPAGSPAVYRIKDRAICTDDGSYCGAAVNGNNIYMARSRFFYLPGPKQGNEEGVWHVRTQTKADNLSGADRAYVYRRHVDSTRCSKDRPLPFFTEEQSMMPISRYQNHHPVSGDSRPPDPGMSNAFHLQIEDRPSSCVKSDDEKVYGDLDKLYNFEGVRAPPSGWARAVSTAAYAGPVQYAGLSAEFAYQDDDKPLCFGFNAPLPTVSGASPEGNWAPRTTLIVIKRFVRRQVFQDFRQEVVWSQ